MVYTKTRQQNDLFSKETKQYKYDIMFLFVVVFVYMLCVMSLFGGSGWAQYMRFIILPLFVFAAYMKVGLHVRIDLYTFVWFLCAVIPSIIVSPYARNAVIKMITVLLMFVACSVYFSSRQQHGLPALYRALVLFAYIMVVINFVAYIAGIGFRGAYFLGYFGNRNAAGPAFVISFILMMAEMWRKQGKKRILPLLCTILSVFMIIQTQSRGSFIGMIIGFACFILFAFKKKDKVIGIFLLTALVVLLFWGRISQWDIVERIIEEGVTRDNLWEEARKTIEDNFFFGVGFSSSQFSNQAAGNENMNFHNSYVSMMADVGFIGVIFFVLMFVMLFIRIINNYKNIKQEERILYIAFLSIAIAFFGLSFGESYLLVAGSPFSFVFWCIMFCMAEYVPKKSRRDNEEMLNSGK